jgi:hypothetical protein
MKHIPSFDKFDTSLTENNKAVEINEGGQIKVGTFVRYKKDKEFTGGKVLSIKGNEVEISNWDGSTTSLPLRDLEYVKSWNESIEVIEEDDTEVDEARHWGEYNTPEGKKGAAEIEKIFSKFEKDAHKVFQQLEFKLMDFKNSDIANKGGLNDTEGDMAINKHMRNFLQNTYGLRNLDFFDFADTLY